MHLPRGLRGAKGAGSLWWRSKWNLVALRRVGLLMLSHSSWHDYCGTVSRGRFPVGMLAFAVVLLVSSALAACGTNDSRSLHSAASSTTSSSSVAASPTSTITVASGPREQNASAAKIVDQGVTMTSELLRAPGLPVDWES